MEIKLKHVLIATGVVVTGVVGWRLLRTEPKIQVEGADPFPRPLTPPPRKEVTAAYPVWDRTSSSRAAEIMVDIYDQMGRPPYDSETVAELAWEAANEIWPDWNWPTTAMQSSMFLQSQDLGLPVWEELTALAQAQLGYRPVT